MREAFLQYAKAHSAPRSNMSGSYRLAIERYSEALSTHQTPLSQLADIWHVSSYKDLLALYEFAKEQQSLPDGGIFSEFKSRSYWMGRFYSAAIKSFAAFLLETQAERHMADVLKGNADPAVISNKLEELKVPQSKLLLADELDVKSKEGKTAMREVKVRLNQGVFRKMVLTNYQNTCCVTGLTVSEVLRASHIIPWAEGVATRMNPANGLCLSATYDAAFDRHLISFDEDYRLILAPSIKEAYTNEAFTTYFASKEGTQMIMPIRFNPDQGFLAKHRDALV